MSSITVLLQRFLAQRRCMLCSFWCQKKDEKVSTAASSTNNTMCKFRKLTVNGMYSTCHHSPNHTPMAGATCRIPPVRTLMNIYAIFTHAQLRGQLFFTER